MRTRPIAYIVDDEPDIRESLAMLLRSVSIDVETYANADTFLASLTGPGDQPAVSLLDVRMSEMSGMALLEQLRRDHPWLPVIMITGYGDVDMAVKAMKLGAKDFIIKPFGGQDIVDRVQEVLRQCPGGIEPGGGVSDARLDRLTPREREVFDRLVSGEGNKAIAIDLGISVRTVESHRASIMEKLGAKSLVDLVLVSLQR